MKRRNSSLLRPWIIFAAATSVFAEDPVMPEWSEDFESSEYVKVLDEEAEAASPVVKEIEEGIIFPKTGPKFEGTFGLGYLYDSNPSLTRNGKGSGIGTLDLGFRFFEGDEDNSGRFYKFDYEANIVAYSDSTARAPGSNVDHDFNLGLGANTGKTKFRMNTRYSINNGNHTDYFTLEREARRAESDDFALNLIMIRDLPHGTLEVVTGYQSRDFQTQGLNDGSTAYGDISWYRSPAVMPKTELGVGIRFGEEDVENVSDVTFVNPSLRVRYRMSSKTSVRASIGRDSRSGTRGSTDALSYTGSLTWTPSRKTKIDFLINRGLRTSYVAGSQQYESTDFRLRVKQNLGRKLTISSYVGIEDAEYSGSTALASRDEEFFLFGADLAHPVRIGNRFRGTASLFYNYTRNDSSSQVFEFEQHVTGIKFGFRF